MFKINVKGEKGWCDVWMEDVSSGTRVQVLPAAGAILNAFIVNTTDGPFNVVDGYEGREDFKIRVHNGFRSAKLSPFVCRLNHSTYVWKDREYKVEKFALNGSAIHGILYDAIFDVLETSADEKGCTVTLRYQYDGNINGYPFPYNCTVKYCLAGENKLSIQTHVSNPAAASLPIPIADGWHPYFRLGGKVDSWWLEIASDKMLEYDEDLIPTGSYVQNGSFFPGRLIGDTRLDNGFLLRGTVSPYCTLKNELLSIEFLAATNYPYLQLYIPDDRKSIAIENLSSAPDAFNNGLGLTVLEPGQKADFETIIRIGSYPRRPNTVPV
jgi:aldose 1-epimerase